MASDPVTDPLALIDESLRPWLVDAVGGVVTGCWRVGIGGSRETYFIDVQRGADLCSMVLRCEGEGPLTGTEFTLQREAVVYRAAERAGLRVPALVAAEPSGRALLIERAAGDSDLTGLDPAQRESVLFDLMDCVAQMHCADIDRMDLPGFTRPVTAQDHGRLAIEPWMRVLAERLPSADPVYRYLGAWMMANAPRQVPRTALLQADTGPGNFVANDGRVSGLIDLELAYLGDPMDDLAWIEMRTAGLGVETSRLWQRYTAASGIPVNDASLDFYRLVVPYRAAIITQLAAQQGGGVRGAAAYVVETERFLHRAMAQLSQLTGVSETVALPQRPPTVRQPWFDQVRETLRAAAGQMPDAFARARTRNAQAFLYYLQAFDQFGLQIEEAERADIQQVFGAGPAMDEQALGARLESAAATGDEQVLRYVFRRAARRRSLWQQALERPARWRD